MPKHMTSKERVCVALRCGTPDRVPMNYKANAGIDARLKAHFGLAADDGEGLRRALGVDFRSVGARYTGPKLHEDVPGREVDIWGVRRRWVEHETGGYWDCCDFPLKNADEEAVARWPMPSPDDFAYSEIPDLCRRHEGYALHAGGAGIACIINNCGFLRTMEQTFVDLITDDPAGLLLIDRWLNVHFEMMRRTLEAGKGLIDFLWLGEDLGTQSGPIIGAGLFRKHIRPRHQRFIDLAREHGIPAMLHTCGSSSWAYEDYIEMGLAAVDTLQPEAKDMSPDYLKKRFGGRLAFHGCISTAGPVAYGKVEDVERNVRETLETMMPGGGYCLAPTHSLQDNSPTENVLAMYKAAREHGRY